MDSKDKAIMDLRKNIFDLKNVIPGKDAQIDQLKKRLLDFENNSAGVDAVRNSLQAERELTVQLNGQLETLKGQVKSLTEENATLKSINLKLQTDANKKETTTETENEKES